MSTERPVPGGVSFGAQFAERWEPTPRLRWFRPQRGFDTEIWLEQLWINGTAEQWRKVPIEMAD